MIIWVTGLSGSGKTTVCEALIGRMKSSVPELVLLDGDVIREIFNDQLGHTEPERVRQIKRIQRLAREMDRQGLIVLVAALYAHPDLLAWNRQTFEDYYEVYLDATVDLVRARDPKGLYAKVASGKMDNVVGIDIPWYAPKDPDLHVKMAAGVTPDGVANRIIDLVPALSSRARRTAANG